jgi:hypothetical protein
VRRAMHCFFTAAVACICRGIWPSIAFGLVCQPLTAYARDIHVLDLGISMRTLPNSFSEPVVIRRPHGWGASSHGGWIFLDLYRQDETLTENQVISDQQYQNALRAKFEQAGQTTGKETIANVDGKTTWILLGTSKIGSRPSRPHFYCHMYLLVDRQLVRLALDSFGENARPKAFDEALEAMLGSIFQPVTHLPAVADKQPPSRILPPFVYNSLPYSEHSMKLGDEGVVDVEFSIDNSGQIYDFKQTYTDKPGLGQEIHLFLQKGVLWLPADFDKSLSQAVPMEFRYSWGKSPSETCKDGTPRRADVAAVMNVCCEKADRSYIGPITYQGYACREELRYN